MNKLSVSRLLIVDPYNKSHIKKINEYETRNNNSSDIVDFLKRITTSQTKEEYLKNKRNGNEIEERLFIEKDSLLLDSCQIQGEKDIKTGRITLSTTKNITNKKKIVSLAVDYALDSLKLEEVFIMLDPADKGMINYLSKQGYEYLGEEQGNILFLKEKEERLKG